MFIGTGITFINEDGIFIKIGFNEVIFEEETDIIFDLTLNILTVKADFLGFKVMMGIFLIFKANVEVFVEMKTRFLILDDKFGLVKPKSFEFI